MTVLNLLRHRRPSIRRPAMSNDFEDADFPLPVALLMQDRWDDAYSYLLNETKLTLAGRLLAMPDDVPFDPTTAARAVLQKAILSLIESLAGHGERESGLLSLAWRMLTVDPQKPDTFVAVMPPLAFMAKHYFTEVTDTKLLAEIEATKLREQIDARLRVWWRAADGKYKDSHVSMFRIAAVDTRPSAIGIDDPDVATDSPQQPEVKGPSVVVMKKPGAVTKGLPNDWKDMIGQAIQLVVCADAAAVRRDLYAEYPHATQAIDLLTRDMRDGQPVRLRPALLVGPPGSGKSRLVRRLGEILGLYTYRYDAAVVADNMFGGLSKGWGSAHPSVPARAVQTSMQANPIVMVDEVEKAADSTHNGNLWHSMVPFLERETSARYRDGGIDAELDLSHVNHVATANAVDRLPSPLRDRYRMIRVPSPTLAHLPALAVQVMRDLARDDDARAHDDPLAEDELDIIGRAWARERFSMRKLQRLVAATLDARDACAPRH
ncbi:MAG: AAA family ATPase [Rhizobiales bacterium]|nr:AAA family ATPase [Hyphomicrobiales bacterium]